MRQPIILLLITIIVASCSKPEQETPIPQQTTQPKFTGEYILFDSVYHWQRSMPPFADTTTQDAINRLITVTVDSSNGELTYDSKRYIREDSTSTKYYWDYRSHDYVILTTDSIRIHLWNQEAGNAQSTRTITGYRKL